MDTAATSSLEERLVRLESGIAEIRDLLVNQRTVKDFYTPDEVAEILNRRPYTIREWCRLGRVNADKKSSGRGKHPAWVISQGELQRIQREGLLPGPQRAA